MGMDMIWTFIILAGAAALFVSGKVRSDLVAICALILLVVLDILEPNEALSGFSNSVVIMMIGLFVVGGGIFHTGLAKKVSGKMLQLAGKNETLLLLTVMGATAFIGAFVSNTGTVAVMLPIVVSLAMSANISPGRLLMPLAFASSLGGTLTLIGTPPNMIIRETLKNSGHGELTFFSFTPIGLVCLFLGGGLIIVLSKWFLRGPDNQGNEKNRNHRSLDELAQQYQLSHNLFRVQVKESSPIIGRKLIELEIPKQHAVHIIEIRRRTSSKNPFFKTISHEIAGPDSTIAMHDILYVYGEFEHVETFTHTYQLQLLDQRMTEKSEGIQTERFASSQVGIAEILLPPNSKFMNQQIKQTGLREHYHLNVLGIQRKGQVLLHQLKDEKIRFGDALLIQGTWEDIERLSAEQSDVVVVGQPQEAAASVPLNHKAPLAAGIMLLMVVLMILEWFPAVVSVMIAAVLMVATGCLRNMEAAYRTINWESIVLIGGMIPMSIAIEKTGAAMLMSQSLVNSLGTYGPLALMAGIYFTTSFLTLFISNTACAVLIAPIALTAATQLGVSPIPYLFAVSISASMCFAVPFSTPPNALVMSAGKYRFIDYVKVGMPLQILMGIAMIVLLPLFFPF